jgi:hypothetical protein
LRSSPFSSLLLFSLPLDSSYHNCSSHTGSLDASQFTSLKTRAQILSTSTSTMSKRGREEEEELVSLPEDDDGEEEEE